MVEILQLPFMQRALIAGVLIGFLASYYGVFVVQRGLGFLGIVIILGMAAAIGLFGLKVLPLYLDNGSVNKAVDDLVTVPGIGKKGKNEIIKRVNGQLYIDAVKSFAAKDLTITKSKLSKRAWTVAADYEARANYIANIDIIVKFSHSVEVPR